MQVETYEVAELGADGSLENLEEARKLIGELDLKGQTKFLDKDTRQVFPYRKMTLQEALVYNTLLPAETPLKEYGDGYIPLRVLQVAAHVTETGFIDTLEVWHPTNADFKDPLLIGRRWEKRSDVGSKWSKHEVYILARWGDVLDAFEVLKEKARTVLLARARAELADAAAKVREAGASLEETIAANIETGKRLSINCYIS